MICPFSHHPAFVLAVIRFSSLADCLLSVFAMPVICDIFLKTCYPTPHAAQV